ncbi:Olfactory receptor 1086 [Lemmus lemmus]
MENITEVTEFVLKGFTDNADLEILCFFLFLAIYLFTLMGNLGLIVLVIGDSRLHNPMYYFLSVLSSVDACYSSVITPQMVVDFMSEKKVISFVGCAAQMFLAVTFGTTECFLLAAMAYDRYVAICKPLLYMVIMSKRVCWVLVVIPYVYCTIVALLITIKIFTMSFCGYNVISHFYCDSLPLLSLVCSNTQEIEVIMLFLAAFNLISSLLVVLVSYLLILIAILRMNSAEGRRKAFSTCGSHLTVVTVFYGTLIFMYVQPKSSHSFDTDKVASIFYTIIIPMLNPLIYSLRNKDVKDALYRTGKKIHSVFL